MYTATMFAVPEEVIKDIDRTVFKFWYRGQDRVVKSVRPSWLERLYARENGGWKCYLTHLFKPFGGLFLFHCDYDPKDYNISNQFYTELIEFWAEFRNAFSDKDNKSSII